MQGRPTTEDPRPPAHGGAARYAVGVVNFHAYADLDRCLSAAFGQTSSPAAVHVVDGDADLDLQRTLSERYPGAVIESRPNRGFAAGANRAVAALLDRCPDVEFVLLLNPDTFLEPTFAECLLAAMAGEPDVAIGTGKLLRPGGRVIDTAGIDLPVHRRPRDRGSEQPDSGQFERREDVFGASGAAMMIRVRALADLTLDGELFDEDFFAYHEDTDVSWRAGRLGWRVLYEPTAKGVHGRGWRREARFDVPVAIRRHSFKNHYLQIIKNERATDLVRGLPALALWEVLRLGFVLLRDPALLPAYRDAWRLRGRAFARRRMLRARIARSQPPAESLGATEAARTTPAL